MKVSYNWLKSYIDFPYSPEELSNKLTMAGLEVEEMDYLGEGLEDIIVAEIDEIKNHPDADKLVICIVNTGKEKLQIITGAPNVKEGKKVPVAKSGVTLPNGMKIEESELRGKKSSGMICSEDELALVDERQDGIMILDDEFTIGNKFVDEYGLDDYIYKLDLTPNYSRCLGMLGIAREIKALLNGEEKVNFPEINLEESEELTNNKINIKIEDEDLCHRYTGRIIKNVKIKESPLWIQKRLKAAGFRPINNIVDITNYVMLEYNQPLHAFDYDIIENNEIIVRRAKENEEITTLDGEYRKLNEDVLLITDPKKAIGMAGVMGGENSEVTEETKNVFLESAYFAPLNIRKTSSEFGIHSDASHRFERGIDKTSVIEASNRAAYLMQKYADAEVLEGLVDKYPIPYKEKTIELEVSRVNRILGLSLADEEIKDMLSRLEFEVEIFKNSGLLKVIIPSYRTDVEQKADLIEEIARMYGYNNILITTPKRKQQGHRTERQNNKIRLKKILTAAGLNEIKTFSLMDKKEYDKLQITNNNLRNWVKIKNPLSKAYEIMRTTLIPGVINVLSNNKRRQLDEMAVFELGRIYENQGKEKRPYEEEMIAGGSMGANISSWNNSAPDFFYLKGVLDELFERFNFEIKYEASEKSFLHPGRTAEIVNGGGEVLGFIGELNYEVIDEYDLREGTTIFELSFDKINEKTVKTENNYQPLPKFPAVNRDLALVVDKDINVSKIKKVIEEPAKKLLEDIQLFDLYEGDQIPEGKKSLAFNLIFRSGEKTLTDKEVNSLFEKILESLKKELGAEIRGN